MKPASEPFNIVLVISLLIQFVGLLASWLIMDRARKATTHEVSREMLERCLGEEGNRAKMHTLFSSAQFLNINLYDRKELTVDAFLYCTRTKHR